MGSMEVYNEPKDSSHATYLSRCVARPKSRSLVVRQRAQACRWLQVAAATALDRPYANTSSHRSTAPWLQVSPSKPRADEVCRKEGKGMDWRLGQELNRANKYWERSRVRAFSRSPKHSVSGASVQLSTSGYAVAVP